VSRRANRVRHVGSAASWALVPISADSVFLDAAVGSEGMRWVVSSGRYGTVNPISARYWRGLCDTKVDCHIHDHPNCESDWLQFGRLIAQVVSGVAQDIATNPAKQGEVVAKAQRIMGVKVIFSRDCSLGHLTDDFAERKFSPTPTVRHLACKGFVYHAPRDARHAA
jgi:hypothetical protein